MQPTIYPGPRRTPAMTELVFGILDLAVEGAIRILRSDEELDEADRSTLAKAAELAAALRERKKFG